AITHLFRRIWSHGVVAGPVEIRECLDEVGLGADAALQAANASTAFRGLDHTLERAVANGVFEVPTMSVRGELFVGFDRFDLAGDAIVEGVVVDTPIERIAPVFAQLLGELPDARRREILASIGPPRLGPAVADDDIEGTEHQFDLLSPAIRAL